MYLLRLTGFSTKKKEKGKKRLIKLLKIQKEFVQ